MATLDVSNTWTQARIVSFGYFKWPHDINTSLSVCCHLSRGSKESIICVLICCCCFATETLFVIEQWYRSYIVAVLLQHWGLGMTPIIFQQGWLVRVVVCGMTARTTTRAEWDSTFRGEALRFPNCYEYNWNLSSGLSETELVLKVRGSGSTILCIEPCWTRVVSNAVSRGGKRCASRSPTSRKSAIGLVFSVCNMTLSLSLYLRYLTNSHLRNCLWDGLLQNNGVSVSRIEMVYVSKFETTSSRMICDLSLGLGWQLSLGWAVLMVSGIERLSR